MKKIVYSPIQILCLCVLVLAGFSLILSDNIFKWEESGNPCTFTYIRQGEYNLTVSCAPAEKANQITVFSDACINEKGEAGVILGRADLEPGQDTAWISLTLEQGVYAVRVATDMDTEDNTFVNLAHLESSGVIYRDGAFLGGLCLLGALALAWIFAKVPAEKYRMPLGAVLFGLLAGIPLYADFILDGNDFNFHLLRIEGLYQAMTAGDFPVRLNPLPISGYGYLSSTMYPQLFLYPAAFLRFLHVSVITCYKIYLTMINVGTALLSYYAVKNITRSEKIGMWASFLYTFSAYRLICVYMRAALGEAAAMAFLPLVVWGTYECLWGRKRWQILTLGMTGVLGSHILSTGLCAMFMVPEFFWWLCSRKKTETGKRILAGVKAGVAALLLNLSFLIPFFYFSTQDLQCFQLTNGSANSAVYFSQMFSLVLSTDGYSVSRGTTVNEMSLTVGTALLAGTLIFFVWAGSKKEGEDRKLRTIGMHCAVYGMAALYLSSWLMPWSPLILRIPIVDKFTASLQFVWRFLGPASIFMVVCSAVGVAKITEKHSKLNWITGMTAALCLFSAWTLFDDLKEFHGQYGNPMAMEAVVDVDELYLYTKTSGRSYSRENAVPRPAGGAGAVFSDYKKEGTRITVNVIPEENKEGDLLFPLYYYPGYEIRVNGEKTESFCADTLLACKMPSGQSHIEVKYAGLPFFKAGDLVSLLAAAGLSGAFIWGMFRRKGR